MTHHLGGRVFVRSSLSSVQSSVSAACRIPPPRLIRSRGIVSGFRQSRASSKVLKAVAPILTINLPSKQNLKRPLQIELSSFQLLEIGRVGILCVHTDTEVMQTGRATSAGTAKYVKKLEGVAGPEHFRKLVTSGPAGDLQLSSIGLGTYLGPDTDEADKEYETAVQRALELGINVLDSAINYRNMRSERLIGRALARRIGAGHMSREEVIVCSKGGFLAFDEIRPRNPGKWIEDNFVKPGLMEWSDFVAGCHCMAPKYITDQIDRSRKNLGLETIDVYYLHNPETQLGEISREEFDSRIRAAFQALEEACRAGKISVYGTATWTGFRVAPGSKDHLSLEDLVDAARDVGGEHHHFRIIQAPFNLAMQEAARQPTQTLRGRQVSLLEAAQELGLYVVASASLMQAQLSRGLPKNIGQVFGELPEDSTDAQFALQFVRTTPGVGTGLVGMRRVEYVEENATIAPHSAAYRK